MALTVALFHVPLWVTWEWAGALTCFRRRAGGLQYRAFRRQALDHVHHSNTCLFFGLHSIAMVDVVKSLSSKCTVLEPARPPSEARKGARPLPRHPSSTWNNATVKAIAPAFRWREMLEDGTYCTIAEIAAAEKIISLMWLASCD